MDFEFTKEQRMFKEEIIRFAKKEITPRAREHDLKETFDLNLFANWVNSESWASICRRNMGVKVRMWLPSP